MPISELCNTLFTDIETNDWGYFSKCNCYRKTNIAEPDDPDRRAARRYFRRKIVLRPDCWMIHSCLTRGGMASRSGGACL